MWAYRNSGTFPCQHYSVPLLRELCRGVALRLSPHLAARAGGVRPWIWHNRPWQVSHRMWVSMLRGTLLIALLHRGTLFQSGETQAFLTGGLAEAANFLTLLLVRKRRIGTDLAHASLGFLLDAAAAGDDLGRDAGNFPAGLRLRCLGVYASGERLLAEGTEDLTLLKGDRWKRERGSCGLRPLAHQIR